MNSFHNVFNSSKINKKNKKVTTMNKYVETLLKTQSLEKEKLQKLKENMNEIEKKIEFNKEIKEEEQTFSNDPTKYIFFSNNNINIETLLSSFETLNEVSSHDNQDLNSTPFEEKLNLRNLNLNIKSNKERFHLEIAEVNKNDLNIDTSNSFSHENSLMIKTVGSTIEENESIKVFNSELDKEIKKEIGLIDIDIENKEKMVDTSIITKIQIINMIYKESYKNRFVTGFGDFLRGSYFFLEFCRKFKIKYNILIYHPIQQFFKNPTINRDIPDSVIDSIEYCEYCNINFDPNSTYNADTSTLYQEFFTYLNRQDIFNRNLFIYTICYPTYQIHNENKQILKRIIEPVPEIENNINQILNQMKLIKKNYIVIQIRSGDEYLNKSNNTLSNEYKEKLLPALRNIFMKNKPFLLIADNLMVKKFVIHHFPFIKTFFKDITHLGDNANLNRENIKNTLIDFYIMSYASFIYSISSYDHGSGFSRWCSVTYDIPYRCIKI